MGDQYNRIPIILPPQTSYYTRETSFFGVKVKKELSETESDEYSKKKKRVKKDLLDKTTTESVRKVYSYPKYRKLNSYEDYNDWAENTKEPLRSLVDIVTREMWGAVEPESADPVIGPPLSKVLVLYTGMDACYTKQECCEAMRHLQKLYMEERKLSDIPWNFLIGCDGRVYEGRGWGLHPKKVNSLYKFRKLEGKSYDIAYIGPYFKSRKDHEDERSAWPKLSFTRTMYHALRVLVSSGVKSNFIDDGFGLESQVGC